METWDPFQLSAGVTGSQVEGAKQNLALQYYFGQTFLILWEYLESKDEHISYDTTKEEDKLNWNKSYILLNGLMVEKLNKPWGSPFSRVLSLLRGNLINFKAMDAYGYICLIYLTKLGFA